MLGLKERLWQLWRGVEARASVVLLLYAGAAFSASLTAVATWERTPLGDVVEEMLAGPLAQLAPLTGSALQLPQFGPASMSPPERASPGQPSVSRPPAPALPGAARVPQSLRPVVARSV